ncbi:hypothetical protein Tco_0643258 [Tanacetum coccineum]
MEDVLKRRHVVLPDSEDEDAEISSKQGRNLQEEGLDEMVRNMMKDKSKVFKTPTQSKTSGEEDISPTTLEAAKTLSKEVNTGGLGVSIGSGPVSSARGQREGKAPMIVEETQAPKRTKEQIQQEEVSLAEAIRLQTLKEEETTKQVHLDALAKLEANAELTKNVLGKELPEEDFAKKMVELVNQRKKFFAEERAKAKELKKLSFEEMKEEFDKLVKQVESFVPINIEATKAHLKRYGEELQTEISKKQRIDDKDVSDKAESRGRLRMLAIPKNIIAIHGTYKALDGYDQ